MKACLLQECFIFLELETMTEDHQGTHPKLHLEGVQ